MVGPCLGVSLQKGVRIIAVLDMLFSGLAVISCILVLSGVHAQKLEELEGEMPNSSKTESRIVTSVLLLFNGFYTGLSVYLLHVAKQKNYHGCKIWVIGTVFCYFFYLASYIKEIAAGVDAATIIIAIIIEYSYRAYAIFVVKCFMKEISNGSSADNTGSNV